MKGHWSRTCRTSERLIKIYQASLKENKQNVESDGVVANFAYKANDTNFDDDFVGLTNITHLDVVDFFDGYE